jgi:RNA polymerase sigma-54 factor
VQPLRAFFQSSASEDGAAPARDAVRDRVRELVKAEDSAAPLSDDALVERLASEGIVLARRTVAKYRKELGIASSYERRR